MAAFDKLVLRKRGIIERIVDQLKNIPQIEHPRHRSVDKILCQLTRGLRGLHLAGEETLPAFA